MATAIPLPKLGQSVESCIIVEWQKKEGDKVTQGEVICEIETDKASLEVESSVSGVVLEIFFQAGDEVLAIPDVVAGGDDVGTIAEELSSDVLGESETASGILAIDDTKVHLAVTNQRRDARGGHPASGARVDVGDEEDSQEGSSVPAYRA